MGNMESIDTLEVKLDEGAFLPIRAHATDAGADIKSREDKIIPPHGSAIFHTGVHIKLPSNFAGVLISKSGLNVKHSITSTGLIDEGYDGEIVVKLYNHGDDQYTIHTGDKISQLMVIPVIYPQIKQVEDLNQKSERGSSGFGSSGA